MKILTAACLPIVLCLILMKPDVARADDDEICYTDTCNKTAEIYSVSMDRSADPCNDYYSYICGEQQLDDNDNEAKLTDEYYSLDILHRIKEMVLNYVSKIETTESANFRRLETYFDSCLNNSESVDDETFSNILSKLGFDMETPYWNQTSATFDWINTTQILLDNNAFGQFLLNVETYQNLDSPFLELKLTNNFYRTWSQLQTLLDNNVVTTSAPQSQEQVYLEVLEFTRKLALLSWDEYKNNRTEISPKIDELPMVAPSIPWRAYIQTIVGSLTNHTVIKNHDIVTPSMEFIQAFEILINDTPAHVILNYIVFAMHISYLTENWMLNKFNYHRKVCLEKNPLNDIIPMILMEAMTAEEKSKREYILNLAEDIRQEFLDVINHEWHWMDKQVKVLAVRELKSIPVVVAYKNISADMERVLHYYDDLEFTGPGIWSVNLQLSKFRLKHEFEAVMNRTQAYRMNRFQKSVIKRQKVPYLESYTSSAYYSKKNYPEFGKMIYITPAGLNHHDVHNQPEYLNLITIGWKIAEMLTDLCITLKIHNDYLIQMRLSESSMKHYGETISCLEDQFWDSSLEVDPEATSAMHKILRLNLGLEIIHRLYRKRLNSTETLHQWKLPNFNKSIDQMFFISAGFQQCQHDKNYPISAEYVLRAFGQNRAEFGEAFSCEQGTKMNPEKKCKF